MLAKKEGGTEFELAPAGNHVARCYSIIDLGYQDSEWQGVHKSVRKIRIAWELPLELMDDGQPFMVSRTYTVSLGDKANLRHDLESWRGRPFTEAELNGFEVYSILGVPCMVNVVHNPSRDGSRTYANVAGVTPLPKGIECPPQINRTVSFDLDKFDQATYDALPEWARKKIVLHVAPEKRAAVTAMQESSFPDDDIPFSMEAA